MTFTPRLVRAELFKFRTTPGAWVCVAVVLLLTGLGITTSFINGSNGVVHFSAPTTVVGLRRLMGAGYTAAIVMAPVVGVPMTIVAPALLRPGASNHGSQPAGCVPGAPL